MTAKKALVYVVLILLIGGGYAFFLVKPSPRAVVPVGGQDGIEDLYQRLLEAKESEQLLQTRIQEVSRTRRYFNPSSYTVNDLQSKVDSIARSAGLSYSNLRSISNPSKNLRGDEEEELIKFVEVSLSGQVDLPALTRFIAQLEKSRPVIYWTSCNITPRHNQGSRNQVFLSARLRSFHLTNAGEQVLRGQAVAVSDSDVEAESR